MNPTAGKADSPVRWAAASMLPLRVQGLRRKNMPFRSQITPVMPGAGQCRRSRPGRAGKSRSLTAGDDLQRSASLDLRLCTWCRGWSALFTAGWRNDFRALWQQRKSFGLMPSWPVGREHDPMHQPWPLRSFICAAGLDAQAAHGILELAQASFASAAARWSHVLSIVEQLCGHILL